VRISAKIGSKKWTNCTKNKRERNCEKKIDTGTYAIGIFSYSFLEFFDRMTFQDLFTYTFGILVLAVPMFAIYRCLLDRDLPLDRKVLWIVVALFVPFFGGLIYLVLFYKKPA